MNFQFGYKIRKFQFGYKILNFQFGYKIRNFQLLKCHSPPKLTEPLLPVVTSLYKVLKILSILPKNCQISFTRTLMLIIHFCHFKEESIYSQFKFSFRYSTTSTSNIHVKSSLLLYCTYSVQ